MARLTFFPFRELRISGSVNWGEYTNNTVSKDYIPMTRYAAGFWYDSEHILVRAEYAHTGSSAAYTDKTTGERHAARSTNRCTTSLQATNSRANTCP